MTSAASETIFAVLRDDCNGFEENFQRQHLPPAPTVERQGTTRLPTLASSTSSKHLHNFVINGQRLVS